MSKKIHSIKNNILNFIFMLNCIKKVNMVLLIILVIAGVIKGILPLAQNYLNKDIIDGISKVGVDGISFNMWVLLILYIFFQCLSYFVMWAENYISQHIGDKIGNYFRNLIIDKCKTTQYKHYYNADFYNQLEKASTGVNSSPLHSVQTIIMFFVMATRMVVSFYILASFNVIIVLILAIFAIPASYIDNKYRLQSFDLSNRLAPARRRISYLFGLFYNKTTFKEMRINNAEEYTQDKANSAFKKYHEENVKHYNKYGVITLLTTLLNIISQGAVYIWIAKATLMGEISLGEFTYYSATAFSFVSLFSNTIQVFSTLQYSLNYIDNLRCFLKMKTYDEIDNKSSNNLIEEVSSIEFKNVKFTYENNKAFSLKNVSFKIKKGEKVALVGLNGAGKTTLLMLLMRFYEPDEGQILINGMDIKEVPLKQYRNLFGTVFQDFIMFSFTLRENIALGDLEHQWDDQRLQETADEAQLGEIFNPLEKYLDVHIGSDFGSGINLSKGQFQRVALARAIYKKSKIMIFDEPTASMDAASEYEIMNKYKELTDNKISFMVSHRLSSTTLADMILFIDDGIIREQGSHEQLINNNGKYAELFKKQAENYMQKY